MAELSYPAGPHDYAADAEEIERLETAMDQTPGGALVVSSIATGLLILSWLVIYFFIFLERGVVG